MVQRVPSVEVASEVAVKAAQRQVTSLLLPVLLAVVVMMMMMIMMLSCWCEACRPPLVAWPCV